MQIISEMLEEIDDANNDDDPYERSSSQKHITIDVDNISSRYHDICPLGCGQNALVFSALDQHCQRRIAVKKVTLKQSTSLVAVKHLLREIRVLKLLEHDNVVKIYHAILSTRRMNSESPLNVAWNGNQEQFPNPLSNDAVYIGMELLDCDLQSVILQQQLTSPYIKLFLYQILRGLKYIHSANVIHRDLTPSNIFINMDTLMLKIGDFGVCRIFDDQYRHHGNLSMATTSTCYQAPELLLHPKHYNSSVDVWGVGCVFAEMIRGKPIFNGENSLEQVDLIINSVSVTARNWEGVITGGCDDARCCPDPQLFGIRENGGRPNLPLRDALPQASLMAINLLQQLLTFDPSDRVTVADALMHPYLGNYSQTSDEPICARPFHVEDELDGLKQANCQEALQRVVYDSSSTEHILPSSTEGSLMSSHCDSKASLVPPGGSYKNLVSMVQADGSPMSTPGGMITESEARTIACDFDYGVQVKDGSINPERMLLGFEPIQITSDCFDPYKWDHHNEQEEESERKTEEVNPVMDNNRESTHSDHGYHSSYASSGISQNRNLHSTWSLSSPEVSVDHDRFSGGHWASTPELGDLHSLPPTEVDGSQSDTRNSPAASSDDKSSDDSRRRHKDDATRHHHHHHHHRHHHHHHHHKHHRHGGRHSVPSPQQQSLPTPNHESELTAPSSVRRHCVVTDVVLEEEGSSEGKDEFAPPKDILDVLSDTVEPPSDVLPHGLNKIEAPSEHWLGGAKVFASVSGCAHSSREDDQIATTSVVNIAVSPSACWRARARSDGSQCKRPTLNLPIIRTGRGLTLINSHVTDQDGATSTGNLPPTMNLTHPASALFPIADRNGEVFPLSRKCVGVDQTGISPCKQVECPF